MRRVAVAAILVLCSAWIPVQGDEAIEVARGNQGGGGSTPILERGPYLQRGTPTSVTVRWRTSALADSRVMFGPAPELTSDPPQAPGNGGLALSIAATLATRNHEITLTDLTPNTRYYYSVGHDLGGTYQLLAGNDADHFFDTPPTAGIPAPIRVWALGDSACSTGTSCRAYARMRTSSTWGWSKKTGSGAS